MIGKGLWYPLQWLTLLSVFFTSAVAANDLAPPGFQWRACKVVECYFLVPDGWMFERLADDQVLKYQIIKTRHNRKIPPRISINILQQTESRTGLSAQRHMELFMGDLERSAKVLEVWKHKSGLLSSTAATSLHYTRVPEPVRKFSLLIRNEQTGTLYVIAFETLPDYWEHDWLVVEQIFTRLRLDDGV